MLWFAVLFALFASALAVNAYRQVVATVRRLAALQRDFEELSHTARALFDLVNIQNRTFQALRSTFQASAERATVEQVLAKFPVPPGAPKM